MGHDWRITTPKELSTATRTFQVGWPFSLGQDNTKLRVVANKSSKVPSCAYHDTLGLREEQE